MENAAKALEIASGVLIALMVLGLVVIGYNNISKVKKEEYKTTEIQQTTNFNNEYEYYNKNGLYGSELLSLANKMDNYNKKYPTSEGYQNIEMSASIKNDDAQFFRTVSSYSSSDLTSKYAELSKKISSMASKKIKANTNETRTIAEWAKLSAGTLNNQLSSNGVDEVNKYKDLLEEQTGFARKTFKCTKVEYDKSNGRITKMMFEDTSK